MRAGMKDADGVFHLAAWYKLGAPDAEAAERINIGGTRNVLELMRDLHIPRGVYIPAAAGRGWPVHPSVQVICHFRSQIIRGTRIKEQALFEAA